MNGLYTSRMQPPKWQRNAIFRAVEAGGLEARECTFDYGEEDSRITHVPSGSYFLLVGDPGHYTATSVVGDSPHWPSDSFSWAKVEERVQRWAEDVKRDAETPDLWAELQRDREILTATRYEDVENTPFTSDERAEIADELREIKEFVRNTHLLSEAKTLSLEAKLDHLEAATDRVGRKDWLLLFLATMFSVIATDLLPQDVVLHIAAMVLHALQHLFAGGAGPLLLSSP